MFKWKCGVYFESSYGKVEKGWLHIIGRVYSISLDFIHFWLRPPGLFLKLGKVFKTYERKRESPLYCYIIYDEVMSVGSIFSWLRPLFNLSFVGLSACNSRFLFLSTSFIFALVKRKGKVNTNIRWRLEIWRRFNKVHILSLPLCSYWNEWIKTSFH